MLTVVAVYEPCIDPASVPAIAEALALDWDADHVGPERRHGLAGGMAHARVDHAVAGMAIAQHARERLRGGVIVRIGLGGEGRGVAKIVEVGIDMACC